MSPFSASRIALVSTEDSPISQMRHGFCMFQAVKALVPLQEYAHQAIRLRTNLFDPMQPITMCRHSPCTTAVHVMLSATSSPSFVNASGKESQFFFFFRTLPSTKTQLCKIRRPSIRNSLSQQKNVVQVSAHPSACSSFRLCFETLTTSGTESKSARRHMTSQRLPNFGCFQLNVSCCYRLQLPFLDVSFCMSESTSPLDWRHWSPLDTNRLNCFVSPFPGVLKFLCLRSVHFRAKNVFFCVPLMTHPSRSHPSARRQPRTAQFDP